MIQKEVFDNMSKTFDIRPETFAILAKLVSNHFDKMSFILQILGVKFENLTELALHLLDKMYVDNRSDFHIYFIQEYKEFDIILS